MRGEVNSLYHSHGCACSPEVCVFDPRRPPWLPAVGCRLMGAAQGSTAVLNSWSRFWLSSYPAACCTYLFPHLYSMTFRSISTSYTPVPQCGFLPWPGSDVASSVSVWKIPKPTSMSVPRISGRHTALLSPSRHACILMQKCTVMFERIWTGLILNSPMKELQTKNFPCWWDFHRLQENSHVPRLTLCLPAQGEEQVSNPKSWIICWSRVYMACVCNFYFFAVISLE